MSGVLNKIRDLETSIANIGQTSNDAEKKKLATLEAQLSVYKQMASTM